MGGRWSGVSSNSGGVHTPPADKTGGGGSASEHQATGRSNPMHRRNRLRMSVCSGATPPLHQAGRARRALPRPRPCRRERRPCSRWPAAPATTTSSGRPADGSSRVLISTASVEAPLSCGDDGGMATHQTAACWGPRLLAGVEAYVRACAPRHTTGAAAHLQPADQLGAGCWLYILCSGPDANRRAAWGAARDVL